MTIALGSLSGPPPPDTSTTGRQGYGLVVDCARRAVLNPVDGCVLTVAAIPMAALTAWAVAWSGLLAVVTIVVGLVTYPLAVAMVRRGVTEVSDGHIHRAYGVVAAAAILAIPLTEGLLASDLSAMSAPSMAAAASGASVADAEPPPAIYGAVGSYPSYAVCGVVRQVSGATLTKPCYLWVGYLRLWQTPTTLPLVLSVLLMTAAFPVLLFQHVHDSAAHRVAG